jgi:hypothetical protein
LGKVTIFAAGVSPPFRKRGKDIIKLDMKTEVEKWQELS